MGTGLVPPSWAVLLVDWVCSGSFCSSSGASPLHQGPLCPEPWPYPRPALGSLVGHGDTFCSISLGTPGEAPALKQPSLRGRAHAQSLPRRPGQAAWLCAAGDGMATLGKPRCRRWVTPAVLRPPWGLRVCPPSPQQGKGHLVNSKSLPASPYPTWQCRIRDGHVRSQTYP